MIVENSWKDLVFAPGSVGRVDWTLAEPWEGCPATGSVTARIGTMDNEVVAQGSEPDPETTGLPMDRGADLELFGLGMPGFERGTGARNGLCLFPHLGVGCGQALIGKLLHANPSEWSFSCASENGGGFDSVGGRLIGP